MATVTITSVIGLGGNPPDRVLVQGTSDGCACVNVKVQCGNFINSGVVQPTGGTWSVEIKVNECRCLGGIVVTAQCDSNCNGDIVAETVFKDRLPCEGQCPNVAVSVMVGDCDPNRFRSVDYILQFAPPLPVGTTGNAAISYGVNNSANQSFGIVPINVTGSPLSSLTHQTLLPPTAVPAQSTVTVSLQLPGQTSQCFSVDPIAVTVPSCLPCPDENNPLTVTVDDPDDWCAPVQSGQASFTATVNWPTGVLNPPDPSLYAWTLTIPGGATATQSSSGNVASTSSGWTGGAAQSPGGPINLSQAGTYAVGCTAVFAPGAGLPVHADGTPACIVSGGATFAIEACDGIITPPPDSGGWGWCWGFRVIGMLMLALALAALLLASCAVAIAPPLVYPLLYTAAGAAILGAILIGLWLLLCPRPCLWAVLLGAQIAIGVGWICIYFGMCCPWLLALGVAIFLSGIVGLIYWRIKCDIQPCRFWDELAYPIVLFVPPIIVAILLIPGAAACINGYALAGLTALATFVAARALSCEGP